MGMFKKSCSLSPQASAPNPMNWSLMRSARIGDCLIAQVHYANCTNFDGAKIMVYRGVTELPQHLDPHFSATGVSPIARFAPTAEGWAMALAFVAALLGPPTP